MLPVAVGLAEAGHPVRLGVMGRDLDIADDPRLRLFPAPPRITKLGPPLSRARCALFLRGIRCLVMDWAKQSHYLTEALTDIARRRGIPSVALPHSVDIVPVDRSYYGAITKDTFGHFDHVVVPNEIRREILIRVGTSPKRITLLGSVRFTRVWSDRLLNVFPPKDDRSQGRLKVAYFDLTVPRRYEPTISMLRRTAGLSFVDLAIQVKWSSRSVTSTSSLVNLFPNQIDTSHASQLCRWADVVVGISSTVMIEALVQGRELIWLKYLDPEPCVLESMRACRIVETENELIDLLYQLHEGQASPRPDPSAFLWEKVHAVRPQEAIADGYVEFLTSLATGP